MNHRISYDGCKKPRGGKFSYTTKKHITPDSVAEARRELNKISPAYLQKIMRFIDSREIEDIFFCNMKAKLVHISWNLVKDLTYKFLNIEGVNGIPI